MAKLPSEPPAADISSLMNKIDELCVKAGVDKLGTGVRNLARWKRWLGGEKPDFDGTGLRDIVKANAIGLNEFEDMVHSHIAADNTRHQRINTELAEINVKLDAVGDVLRRPF